MRSQKTFSKFSTHILVLFFAIIAGGLICLPLLGAELPNAKELVRKAELLLRGEESSVQFISLTSIRPGKKMSWEMIIYRKGTDYCFCHVTKPIKFRNTTLLKRKKEVWVYDSQSQRRTAIQDTQMQEKLFESDFTYEDILQKTSFAEDYSHKIVGISKKLSTKDSKVYVIDLKSLPDRSTPYAKLRLWIREKGFVLLRKQYYDSALKVYRVMKFSDISELAGREMPTLWTMYEITKKGHFTRLEIKNARFNQSLDEKIFEPGSLSNPPKPPSWLE
jgi:outer membrane lipoprotein-sorting protein